MPLENSDIIDEILAPDDGQRIGLVITDSGAVADPQVRLNLLKKKFQFYVESAMEGSVHPSHRYTDPNDFYIEVVCVTRPTKRMLEITQVAREGDTKHRLKVNYRESQAGIWSQSTGARTGSPVESIASDSLNDVITAAFEAGHNCLRAGEAPLLLLFVENGKAYLTPLKEVESEADIASALADWAEEHAAEVSTCVFVHFATEQTNQRRRNSLVAQVFQARAKEGLILAQELYEDHGVYHGGGTLLFLGCCENLLLAGGRLLA
jgi:hypothetical protein